MPVVECLYKHLFHPLQSELRSRESHLSEFLLLMGGLAEVSPDVEPSALAGNAKLVLYASRELLPAEVSRVVDDSEIGLALRLLKGLCERAESNPCHPYFVILLADKAKFEEAKKENISLIAGSFWNHQKSVEAKLDEFRRRLRQLVTEDIPDLRPAPMKKNASPGLIACDKRQIDTI